MNSAQQKLPQEVTVTRASVSLAAVMACLVALPAGAAPDTFIHQGRLALDTGEPLTGSHSLRFAIYDRATAGTELWSETLDVEFADGFYGVLLGATEPLGAVLTDCDGCHLTLSVDGGDEFEPRQPVASVPFAHQAKSLESGATIDVAALSLDGTEVLTDASQVLGGLDCSADEVAVFSGLTWSCGPDRTLTAAEVDAIVADNGYALAADLATVATSGAFADLAGIPAGLADGDDVGLTGTGTTGALPRFAAGGTLEDSLIADDGDAVTVGGDLAVTDGLQVNGPITFNGTTNERATLAAWAEGSTLDTLLPGSTTGAVIESPPGRGLAVQLNGNEGSEVFAVTVNTDWAGDDYTPDEVAFVVANNGNVGIGHAQPGAKLFIEGDIRFEGGTMARWSDADNPDVDALLPGTPSGTKFTGLSGGHVTVAIEGNDSADSFSVLTDGDYDGDLDTVAFFARSDGNVGIGTSAPEEMLHVAGNLKVDGTITGSNFPPPPAPVPVPGASPAARKQSFELAAPGADDLPLGAPGEFVFCALTAVEYLGGDVALAGAGPQPRCAVAEDAASGQWTLRAESASCRASCF